MYCLRCGHDTHPDREMDREQGSTHCPCRCHPWNRGAATVAPRLAQTEAMPQATHACSHVWQDESTRGQLVGHAVRVAPYIEAGNWQAMQPGHTYVCVNRCGQRLTIPEPRRLP